ncbi:MAG: hypothetical protein AAF581_05990 [Planctomycetota bacterium]
MATYEVSTTPQDEDTTNRVEPSTEADKYEVVALNVQVSKKNAKGEVVSSVSFKTEAGDGEYNKTVSLTTDCTDDKVSSATASVKGGKDSNADVTLATKVEWTDDDEADWEADGDIGAPSGHP